MKLKFNNIRKSFVHVFGGNVLTENFFAKNLMFIVILVVIMILFISHRYTVIQRIAEMERLKVELKDAKYESLDISSDLTEASRQSQIEKRVEQSDLGLKVTTEPVYRIQKGKK
ncbi:FtsL-like putative cell division protein [Petrimonas sp.]|uniref:FtsL-like putative cell division protein n=1 Tax=Petrimonas sp. TaxID=2023866 RepID=UPI003F518464